MLININGKISANLEFEFGCDGTNLRRTHVSLGYIGQSCGLRASGSILLICQHKSRPKLNDERRMRDETSEGTNERTNERVRNKARKLFSFLSCAMSLLLLLFLLLLPLFSYLTIWHIIYRPAHTHICTHARTRTVNIVCMCVCVYLRRRSTSFVSLIFLAQS